MRVIMLWAEIWLKSGRTVINSRDCRVEGLPLPHLEVRLEPQALVHAGRVESPRGGVSEVSGTRGGRVG